MVRVVRVVRGKNQLPGIFLSQSPICIFRLIQINGLHKSRLDTRLKFPEKHGRFTWTTRYFNDLDDCARTIPGPK